jgi:CRP-like cAMP-binding protein
VSEALAGFALLAQIPRREALVLAEVFEWFALEPGEVLFREGDLADALWLVLEGTLELESSRASRRGRCGAGEALGALSLVSRGRREATARTLSRCRLLRLGRSTYERLVASAPAAACRLAEAIARDCAGSLRSALDALDRGGLR